MAAVRNTSTPREAYFRQTFAGISWHPVASEAISEPKVSSITVVVDCLTIWQDEWLQYHDNHAFEEDEDCIYGELEEGHVDNDEPGPKLLRCCGMDRPKNVVPLLITASNKPYVTVHDYITAVHPWLLSLREKILWAENVWDGTPWPAENKLMVDLYAPERLLIYKEANWIVATKPLDPLYMGSLPDPKDDVGALPSTSNAPPDYKPQVVHAYGQEWMTCPDPRCVPPPEWRMRFVDGKLVMPEFEDCTDDS